MTSLCIKPRLQSNPVECAPTCIKMVLDAYSRKYKDKSISPSMKKIKELVGYNKKWGTPPDSIADGLNTYLSQIKLKITKGSEDGRRIVTFKAKIYKGNDIDFLRKSIANTYPIVAVSLRFFDKEHVGYHPDVSDDISLHEMVVISVDDRYIYLVDPLRRYTPTETNTCYQNNLLADSSVLPPTKIPIMTFEKAWDETYKWVLLIEEHVERYKKIEHWIGDVNDNA